MKKLALFLAHLALVSAFVTAAEIPRKAPELSVATLSGQQAKLSDYAGNVVIVVFILTT